MLVKNGCIAVSEGANMPTNLDGVHIFKDAKIMFAPGKAANRSEEHTSELQSLMRNSYAVFCLNTNKTNPPTSTSYPTTTANENTTTVTSPDTTYSPDLR